MGGFGNINVYIYFVTMIVLQCQKAPLPEPAALTVSCEMSPKE